MSLHPKRVRSYLCGAFAGAFTVVAAVAHNDGSRERAGAAAALATACGALSVAYEEAAQRD
ncbi:hypothetical protein [Salinigranum halophilum]|uniref:hypothetical protein n=1 Tax=Salinigranum halophilum TaxID=2565931 RepID=UPI0010A75163|nr:hypothetical protein [Salinigranum halophilum]